MSLLSAHHNSMATPRQPGRRSRARAGASGSGGLAQLFAPLARLLAPLNDPANMTAQLGVAAVLLLAEAVLCLLIIRRVPCECRNGAPQPLPSGILRNPVAAVRSCTTCLAVFEVCVGAAVFLSRCLVPLPADTEIDWEAYMQEVTGYLEVQCHPAVPAAPAWPAEWA
jgi:hypothetical protein